MLHAENEDRLYLVAQSDEQQALIDGFAINVQDRQWLVYCALGGHAHEDLPEVHAGTGFSWLDFHIEAAGACADRTIKNPRPVTQAAGFLVQPEAY